MLWLWATQLDDRRNYIPALVCFAIIVVMWLPRATGRLAELLHRSLGVVFILLAVGAALSVVMGGGGLSLKTAGAIVLSLVLLAIGWARLFPNHWAPIPVDHDDPVMQEAIKHAQRELPRFRAGVAEGRKEAFVKFPLKAADPAETEHIWGVVHSLTEDAAQVSLANEPVHEREEQDLRFQVPLADIEDWTLCDAAGNYEGGYTHLALARIYKREKGFLPRAMRKQLAAFRDIDLNQI
jgi:uncharacterized protein YegJ (DUF2314 family)